MLDPMSLPLLLRLTVALGGGGIAVRSTQASSGQPGPQNVLHYFYDRLTLDEAEMAALSEEMSEFAGYSWQVATYSAPFELRKVQFIWSMTDTAPATNDARVITFHLAKLSGGAVVDTWGAPDFAAVDAAYTAWWTALKVKLSDSLVWDRLKLYKAGPAIVPPQVPVYDADKNVSATGTTGLIPPQVACSVTEIAGSKRYWGRFYLPTPASSCFTFAGRFDTAFLTVVADATDTLYTALRTANIEPVVYRAPLPERETRAGSTLPARAGSAWTVEKIQVDDVPDVIRRRRHKYPNLRVQRDI
jgi:hypothetical protein